MIFQRIASVLYLLETNRLLVCVKRTLLIGVLTSFLGAGLLSCHQGTVENGPIPDITVAATTTAAIQAAIDAAPSTGARIILPPGDYKATAQVNLTSKNRITLDGQGKVNWIGSNAVPNLFAVLGTCRNIRLTGINFSTTAGSGKYNYGLICTFEQSFIDGYEIDHCRFTAPDASLNLIHFLPYSPVNESGNGRGAMHRNINIHDCIATDGGRAFCEVNSHVHADGKADIYFENFRFCNNSVTNMGTQNPDFGPALSLSGIGNQITVDSNTISDTKYCGLEFVNVQNVSSTGNRFDGVKNTFNAYSVSRAGTGKTTGVTLINNSGTVKGRAYALHDIESFSVTGGTFTSDQKVELLRAKNGSISKVSVTVINDVNAMTLAESETVEMSNNTLTMTATTNPASVITIPVGSRSIVVKGNTLSRPASATGNFVQSDPSDGNTIGPNTELTLK